MLRETLEKKFAQAERSLVRGAAKVGNEPNVTDAAQHINGCFSENFSPTTDAVQG